jgi:hypothetical protein
MVSGITPPYSSYGAQQPQDDHLTPFQRSQLKDVSDELKQMFQNLLIEGLSGVDVDAVNKMKSQIEAILSAKPSPSPQLASKCEQILKDLDLVILGKQTNNIVECNTFTQEASDLVKSALS